MAEDFSINTVQMEKEMSPLLPGRRNRSASIQSTGSVQQVTAGRLGAFEGVFVPCVLSIFSVVLFLRLGYIVGQAGLVVCLSMLVVSYLVVFLTILSISGIATNGLVRGGGAYYMISRSLGPEFGGSIGIIFYFANVFSSGLYVVGFVEALNHNFPSLPGDDTNWDNFAYGSLILMFCLIVCLIGAKAFAKTSLLIWLAVMMSVLVAILNFFYAPAKFDVECPPPDEWAPQLSNTTCPDEYPLDYTRWSSDTLHQNLKAKWTIDYTTGEQQDLRTVFAVLFNGCTGIMAGANISGDLKDASTAIPYGTMAASAFTFIVYIILFTLSAGSCTRGLLLYQYSYLQDINVVPGLVVVGIFAATLSAALSCLIGASRILQAIARDRLVGEWFSFFSSEPGEPVRAILFSWFLIELVVMIGQVNTIAPIVSMLYLISYAITNFACFALAISGAPNFRPTFHFFSWHTALLGFLGCLAVMYYVNTPYAGATCALAILFWIFIHLRHIPVEWGDVSQALMYHQVRKYLLRLRPDAASAKYWRPQVLLFGVNPRYSFETLRFVNELKKGGLLVVGKVLTGEVHTISPLQYNREVKALLDMAHATRLKMFADVAVAPTVRRGAQQLLMTSGLGTMRPNTILLGFYGDNCRDDQLIGYRSNLKEINKSYFGKRVTVQEFDEMMQPFPVADVGQDHAASNPALSMDDYVGILRDSMRFSKNIGVLRNMETVSSRIHTAKSYSEQYYIDVWPVTSVHLQSYELLLQLAQILRSTRRWRDNTKLRVFAVSTPETHESEYTAIFEVLKSLRIEAKIQIVDCASFSSRQFETMEVQACHALNQLMKEQTNTCVIFCYLPEPPEETWLDGAAEYVQRLDVLTKDLPPIVLARGAEFVATHHAEAV